jgi:hypothetical protein
MSKNGDYIGGRYVKTLLVSRQEMEEQVTFGTAAVPSRSRAVPLQGVEAAGLWAGVGRRPEVAALPSPFFMADGPLFSDLQGIAQMYAPYG